MIKAFLFDLDGTLVDTECLAMAAGIETFAALGVRVEPAFMQGLVGVDLPTSAARIARDYPLIDIEALNRGWSQRFRAAMSRGLPVKPGARQLLEARLCPMAVVTSSGRAEAQHKLALVGFEGFFDHVITYDDVTAPKPAPEPYRLAAERLGLRPEDCLAFEDSETGAEAAHRAGCRVVQVPDVVPSSGRWAHHLASSLIEGATAAGCWPRLG